jgi:heme/copper-type cytochrome/quinol oxidase subunit 2
VRVAQSGRDQVPEGAARSRCRGRPGLCQHSFSASRPVGPLATGAPPNVPSLVHAVALIVSVGVLLVVQVLLIRRTLDARARIGAEPPGESPARELMWAALPALLLLALVLYSLRYARFI